MNEHDYGMEGNANPADAEDSNQSVMPAEEQKPIETEGNFGELPEEVKDRTKEQFEKLKATNQSLAEKLRRYEQSADQESVYDSFRGEMPQYENLNKSQVDNIAQQFVDQYGNVDINALNGALVNANKVAQEAALEARRAREDARRAEEDRQVREAHAQYPWLDPRSDEFDPQGYELVKDRVLRGMYEGKKKSLTDIAAEVTKVYKAGHSPEKVREEAVSEFKESQIKKAQVSNVTRGTGQNREETPLSDLRERTKSGDERALDQRLSRLTSGNL